ncbi:MAG: alpha/beta hydrolase [Actinobacteria bacterium]|nr:alpha/beta hydrolase [Actinomycetota bacterium]
MQDVTMMASELKEFQQNISGIDTFYLHSGRGQPIVFLHGVPSFSYLWRKVMPFLESDFSVYAPDLPGYARSENLPDFSLKNYSKWLFDFCDFIGKDEKIDLVIHDVGGPVGLAFVLEYPEKINRLVIMDTVASSKDLPLSMKIVINPGVVWAYLKLTNRAIFKWIMKLAVCQKDKLDDETINRYYQVFLRDKKDRTTAKIFEVLKAELDKTVGENISKINCPTLILWAEKDFILPLSWAESIKARIKNSTLKTLPNCGHFSQEEEPELIARHIKEFLDSP